MILGTKKKTDVLSAQADGDIVSCLAGNDHLNSAFNWTALIDGNGEDTLMTKVSVPLQSDVDVHGLAVQFGGVGNDTLDATVTLQGQVGGGYPFSAGQADVLWRQRLACHIAAFLGVEMQLRLRGRQCGVRHHGMTLGGRMDRAAVHCGEQSPCRVMDVRGLHR